MMILNEKNDKVRPVRRYVMQKRSMDEQGEALRRFIREQMEYNKFTLLQNEEEQNKNIQLILDFALNNASPHSSAQVENTYNQDSGNTRTHMDFEELDEQREEYSTQNYTLAFDNDSFIENSRLFL